MSKSAAALGPQDAFPLLVPSLLSSKPCKERTAGWERILRAVKGSETRPEAESPGLGGTLAAVNGTPPTATPQAAGRILCYPGPGLQRLTYFAVFMNEERRKLGFSFQAGECDSAQKELLFAAR